MTRRPLALTAVLVTAACAGRTPAPAAPRTAVAPAAPAAPRDPATLAYVVGNARYRLEQTTRVVQEVMGQVNTTDLSSRQVLSAVITQGTGNLALALTFDSIEVSDPTGSTAGITAARGQTFRLVLAPAGLVVSTTAPDAANPVFRQISSGLSDLLPHLPSSPVSAGQTWSDTVTRAAGDAAISTRLVRQHHVVGWEDRDGARALHITTTSAYTVTGTTEAQGQHIELSGNGVSTRDAFVSAAGLFLGSVESDSALVNANVTSVGLVVPVRQARRTTITRIP
jgi:hypothetical protein